MTYNLSRIMSAATAGYAVFALAKPRHLADGLEAPAEQAPAFDAMAYTYAARDLPVSAMGVFGDEAAVTAAMTLRIVGDLTDAAILSVTGSDEARPKLLGVTVGWATLNALALMVDRRRANR